MAEHGITLHPFELAAALAGKLRRVRRPVVPQPTELISGRHNDPYAWSLPVSAKGVREEWPLSALLKYRCPLGQPGDVIWGRETWGIRGWMDDGAAMAGCHPFGLRLVLVYRGEDGEEVSGRRWYPDTEGYSTIRALVKCYEDETRWRSPITMPRWASRWSRPVTAVRVERVQDMTREDAIACLGGRAAGIVNEVGHYKDEWNRHYARKGYLFDGNPWAWVADLDSKGE